MHTTFFKFVFVFCFSVLTSQALLCQTQSDMNDDAAAEYTAAQAEMNKVYQQIQKAYQDDPLFLEKLKLSQDLWLKFRDAELAMKFPAEEKYEYYGSVYGMCASYCLLELTQSRTLKLREWLEPVKDDACAGSRKY